MARLGQNFLADPNLLDAIVRDANLAPGDVVLEIGAGEGVLTGRLADATKHVHAIEIDRRLEQTLAAVGARPNVELVWGDAMRIDLGGLHPAPTAVVANLPYSIATPILLRTVDQLPFVEYWTVMVQREIAERLRAKPGTSEYGAPSVLLQLSCEVKVLRVIPPEVFRPRPRVESALLSVRRTGPPPDQPTREVVHAAFAHRRKTLARSLDHARPGTMGATRYCLRALELSVHTRAEAVRPEDFPQIAHGIPWKPRGAL